MALIGTTFFAGDSITVGLPPFVSVVGDKITEAQVGRSVSQIRDAVRSNTRLGDAKNMVVLGGTNDIGGGKSAADIFAILQQVWAMGKEKGAKIIALTVPPAKGYSGFASNFESINAKRLVLNNLIKDSLIPDQVVDLDVLLGVQSEQDRLAPNMDSGDHLHPRKDAMGAALNTVFAKPFPQKNPGISPLQVDNTSTIVIGSLGIGAAGYGLFRIGRWKGWF